MDRSSKNLIEHKTPFNRAIFAFLLTIPVISTLAYGAVDSSAIGILAVLAFCIVALWIADSISLGRMEINLNALQLPLLALALLGAVQLLPFAAHGVGSELIGTDVVRTLSIDPYSTRIFIVRAVVFIVFFAAFLTFVRDRSRILATLVITIIFGALLAFFGILQRLADLEAIYGLRPTPQAVPFGPFVNQHHFASFMQMTAGLALALVIGRSIGRDKRIFAWAAILVMTLAIIFTGSRGGLIGFLTVIAFVITATLSTRNGRDRSDAAMTTRGRGPTMIIAGSAAIAGIMIVIGLAVFLGAGDNYFRGIGLDGSPPDPTSGRLHFWAVALKIFAANPVFGAGLESFGVAFTAFDTRNGVFRVEYAHNEYLQMLADGGVVGLAIVVSFVFLLFRSGLRSIANSSDGLTRAVSIGGMAGCFGILVHSFFDFPLRTTSNGFYFLILASLATLSSGAAKRGADFPASVRSR